MKKLNIRYFTARKWVLLALIAAMAMLVAYMYVDNDLLQKALLILASITFFGSFIVMTIWFRCPVCGCPFMRKALMITKCPACGHKLDDFVLGEKIEDPNFQYAPEYLDEEEEELYLEDEEESEEEEYTEGDEPVEEE